MRKFMVLVLFGAFALIAWDTESSACWRQRGWRRYRSCYVAVYPAQPGIMQAAPTATVRAQVVATKPFTSPNGRVYRIHQTSQQDLHEEAQVQAVPQITPSATGDNFLGKDRKAAKTSLAMGDVEPYDSVDSLLAILPPDAAMMNDPGISTAEDSQRVPREQHNVTVPAYLYAASKEKDNDYHLILGGANALGSGSFLNAEISGLPQGPFRQALSTPRQAFKTYFGTNTPDRSYAIYDPPIPVRVTGSLFYDIDHAPGVVGPGEYKPHTSWEIHPISSILFEP